MTADVLVLTAAGIGCLLALPLLPQAPQPAAPRVEGRVIAPGATLEKLAGGFAFTEGPTSDRDGNVFFTDQPNNRILKWSVDGKLSTFLQPAGRVERDVLRRQRATCSPARTRRRSCGRSRRTARTRCSRAHTTASRSTARTTSGCGRTARSTSPTRSTSATGGHYSAPPQGTEQVYFLRADRKTLHARDRPISSSPTASSARRTARRCSWPTSAPARPTRSTSSPTAA